MICDVSTRVEHIDGYSVAVVKLGKRFGSLSSTIVNGGLSSADSIVIMQVGSDFRDEDPKGLLKKIIRDLGLHDDTIGFMTAAEVDYVLTKTETEYNGVHACAVVTAGLSNQVVAGEIIEDWESRHKLSLERRKALTRPGTINIIGIVSEPLTNAAKVNAVIAMTEAKTAALNDLGYRETGTTTDAVSVLCPMEGERTDYAGTGSDVGIALARAVRRGVRDSLIRRGDFPSDMSAEEIAELKERFE